MQLGRRTDKDWFSGSDGSADPMVRARGAFATASLLAALAIVFLVFAALRIEPAYQAWRNPGVRGTWIAQDLQRYTGGSTWVGEFRLPNDEVPLTNVALTGSQPVHAGEAVPAVFTGGYTVQPQSAQRTSWPWGFDLTIMLAAYCYLAFWVWLFFRYRNLEWQYKAARYLASWAGH